jgi:hypothetical protein
MNFIIMTAWRTGLPVSYKNQYREKRGSAFTPRKIIGGAFRTYITIQILVM